MGILLSAINSETLCQANQKARGIPVLQGCCLVDGAKGDRTPERIAASDALYRHG
ncbi:hypothetical protein RE628_19100 [Paenibacillus sp. D2_2]|uniref:hypothetical protein n=1 Tax=Paenibacillus sp. D2_2 TaxID=3073092 RepID=UPI0028151B8C|nr:hypothetical protein [Paenibacillus sp. D2_2]WMT39513.1 hypothetical protein RE628_19100 [Paenibacillus sp. D2_2]